MDKTVEMNDGKANTDFPKGDGRLHRDYGMILDSSKYNRNWGFKIHDNAYGINGGGDGKRRKAADQALLAHLKGQKDPMAYSVYVACRTFGWAFFNYHGRPWRGQLSKKYFKKK